jgi:hypothetical protein
VEVCPNNGVAKHCKITNPKHQIPIKSQIPIFKHKGLFGILNFGHCDLFVICDLLFGISDTQSSSTSEQFAIFTGKAIKL